MRQLLILLIVSLFQGLGLHSQNLVANSGFESVSLLGKNGSKIEAAQGWRANPKGFIRLYQGSSLRYAGRRAEGLFPKKIALSGNSCGLFQKPAFLKLPLQQPLEAGKKYRLQIHLNCPEAPTSKLSPVLRWPSGKSLPIPFRANLAESTWQNYSLEFQPSEASPWLEIGFLDQENAYQGEIMIDDIWIEPLESAVHYGTQEGTPQTPEGYTQWLPNPGMESIVACPLAREEFQLMRDWKTGKNTPDLFHLCAAPEGIGPLNELGYQVPHSGKGMAGFWATCGKAIGKEEYLLVDFPMELKGKTRFELDFYLSLADASEFALENIQIKILRLMNRGPREFDLALPDGILDQKGRWMHIVFSFDAKGDEVGLMIGNFRSYKKTPKKRVSGIKDASLPYLFRKSAYYYIDDITLTAPGNLPSTPHPKAEDPANPGPSLSDSLLTEIETRLNLQLRDIQFAFDSDSLEAASYPLLDSVAMSLKALPECLIQVNGHTDNRGDATYNLELSRQRARRVAQYLASKGIPAYRIKFKGHGESQPLTSNRTSAGRQANRRVVIRLIR